MKLIQQDLGHSEAETILSALPVPRRNTYLHLVKQHGGTVYMEYTSTKSMPSYGVHAIGKPPTYRPVQSIKENRLHVLVQTQRIS